MKKCIANRNRYRSDVYFNDSLYDASWKSSKYFSNHKSAFHDNIERTNKERRNADPGVYVVSGGVFKEYNKFRMKNRNRK